MVPKGMGSVTSVCRHFGGIMNRLNELKNALIEQIKDFEGHPVKLIETLLITLYTAGYIDGQEYMMVREDEDEER